MGRFLGSAAMILVYILLLRKGAVHGRFSGPDPNVRHGLREGRFWDAFARQSLPRLLSLSWLMASQKFSESCFPDRWMIDGYSQHLKWTVAATPGSCHRALCRHRMPGRHPLCMMPGLTTTTALSLLTGLTFSLAPEKAIAVVLGAYVGSVTGGSRSAILINIPGTPAQAAVCLDGYPLAQQGKAAQAIGLSVTASTLGTLIGFISLAFSLLCWGHSPSDLARGSFSGWLCSVWWLPEASAPPMIRSKAGSPVFWGCCLNVVVDDGIPRDPAIHFQFRSALRRLLPHSGAHRAYGVPEVAQCHPETGEGVYPDQGRSRRSRFREVLKHRWIILRSSVIGIIIGIIPGVGSDTAAWLSYFTAKRGSKHPELFGKGLSRV